MVAGRVRHVVAVVALVTLAGACSSGGGGLDHPGTAGEGTSLVGTDAPAQPCRSGGECAVGDTGPGGGIVFYVADSPQPWGTYLEAPHADWNGGSADPAAKLGCSDDTVTFNGALSAELGGGLANTRLLRERCAEQGNAIGLVSFYIPAENGVPVTDWYLPNSAELLKLLDQHALFGDLNGDPQYGSYWSSSSDRTLPGCSGDCFVIGAVKPDRKAAVGGGQGRWIQFGVRPIHAFGPTGEGGDATAGSAPDTVDTVDSVLPPTSVATGGSTTTTTKTTTPSGPPVMTVSPLSLDFGSGKYGSSFPERTVTVTNAGGGTLSFTSFTLPATGEYFTEYGNTCRNHTLAAGQSCTVTFAVYWREDGFSVDPAPTEGAHSNTFTIGSNGGTANIGLTYTYVQPT